MKREKYFVVVFTLILLAGSISHADNIYTTHYTSGSVVKINSIGTQTTFASGLSMPMGLAFSHSGNLYVTDYTNGTIKKFNSNGAGTTFASGLDHPAGIAFDSKDNLYVANYYSQTIDKISPNGTRTNFVSGADAWALVFDGSDNLYAGEMLKIEKISSSGIRNTFASDPALYNASGLAFDTSGYLYKTNQNGTIVKISPSGNLTTFASGLGRPGGLAFDSSGNLYVAITANGTIDKFNPSGNMSVFASGLSAPFFVTTQVPEPATILLLGLGAAILRKRKG